MLDIKWIREHPEKLDAALKTRGEAPAAQGLIALDKNRRALTQQLQDLQTQRNAASKSIGAAKAAKNEDKAQAAIAQVAQIKGATQALEDKARALDAEFTKAMSHVANVPLEDVPAGHDETDNVFHHEYGEKPAFDFEPKQHFELGEARGEMDFTIAAQLAGARHVVLRSHLARLHRALGQFMIDLHTKEHGYEETCVPMLVLDQALYGTGQLPKFKDDLYKTDDSRWLIPTSEVPLTNLVRDQILEGSRLPMRVTTLTSCFRSEAGSAGRDTRGMLRQHQFDKVELVSITQAEDALCEQLRMLSCAEEVLRRLELHYRVVTLCTGDMGFSAQRTYDIEVWLPGQNAYREISSCSVCGDFQARRMNARYRDASGAIRFVHTLNGSGVAVGRALIAVLENHQQADGHIKIPEALRPYMAGRELI